MMVSMRFTLLLIALGVDLVHSAIFPNGTQAIAPVRENDPSPIGDPDTYYPDQHDCPLPCADYANMHSWIPYFSVERLHRCNAPMLLQFSVSQPLDNPSSTNLIRSCTLATSPGHVRTAAVTVENPKKNGGLFQGSLQTAPACASSGKETQGIVKLASGSVNKSRAKTDPSGLLEGLESFFAAEDNCDEKFVFGYHNQTVVGVYSGAQLGKRTAVSALQALAVHFREDDSAGSAIAQLCEGRPPERVLGISVDTSGNLAAVQKTALGWSSGSCASEGSLLRKPDLPGVTVLEIDPAGNFNTTNSTIGTPDFSTKNGSATVLATRKWKREAPKAAADGTCATHLIVNDDTCDKLAKAYGVTVSDIEKWNKGKTWAWTECKDILIGYNMCVSDGSAPMPPPQAGTECGPMVPGTQPPKDKTVSIAELNPCPLKACCSNWGFCGVFPAHCDVHAPPGGGPGSKLKEFQTTCVANCGNEIKQNSGAPKAFQRIGYYESYNFERDCLYLKAMNANTDGSYTHMHWAFADIDPKTWKPIINDKAKQWDDFKKLQNMKRIVSLGGWAYSTEPATYNIIRQAIINNRDVFAANLAQFVKDEGIDGIDIDWEYPGAPDIMVGGQPIGQKTDGIDYLKFLTILKKNLGADKSVSIAAPASYWYLKAFPIDRITAAIDYIVYMTYDLHGQWDYGNPNAYDSCPSGKCIRSHVNLTETRNSLAMITKAGAANNKIFVGEASYGRSFHMAVDGCWGPTCDFTGSRTQSDALPGRCTNTGGYLAYAEINEIINSAGDSRTFHDQRSNTDIMIYKGDYISYMTPQTKDTRRADWQKLNFAGSIDWAVDLQSFGADEYSDSKPERPDSGEGCIRGRDSTLNSGELCAFSCNFGFCPESLCECRAQGDMKKLPEEKKGVNVIAWDEINIDLTRLCKFACKYGYCPEDICTTPINGPDESGPIEVGDNPEEYFNYTDVRWQNSQKCVIFKDPKYRDVSVNMCKPVCQDALDEAKEEGRTSNYGCMGFWPLDKEIPWERPPGASSPAAPGQCLCDNMFINELADTVIEALPMIAQIGCYILMSSLKVVLDIGAQFIPGVGKAVDVGLDMAMTAAQMAAYLYPEEEDPEGAFSWWLSPCGGTDLVPDEIKKIFDILSSVPDGVSSFKKPKKLKKGSGKKGDDGNPSETDRGGKKRPAPGGGNGNNAPRKKKCRIPPSKSTLRMGEYRNTLRMQSCVNDQTEKDELVVTSLAWAANAKPKQIRKECPLQASQACYHYSSAIRVNPQWATITCHEDAAATRHRLEGKMTVSWKAQHTGAGWTDETNREHDDCEMDEFPPAYLLHKQDPAWYNGGKDRTGQLMRWLPADDNGVGGKLWKGVCFKPPMEELTDTEFKDKVNAAANKQVIKAPGLTRTLARATVTSQPEFILDTWAHSKNPPPNDGLNKNKCWPSGIAAADPGFVLLNFDPFYNGQAPPYDYTKPYKKGSNGS